MQSAHDITGQFWHRQTFNWADDVEEEILKKETAVLPPSEPFDWAEDAEEEFLKKQAEKIDLSPSEPFDWAEDAEDELLKRQADKTDLTPSEPFDWTEDAEDDLLKKQADKIDLSPSEPFDWADDPEDEIIKIEDVMPELCVRSHFDLAVDIKRDILQADAAKNEWSPSSVSDWDQEFKWVIRTKKMAGPRLYPSSQIDWVENAGETMKSETIPSDSTIGGLSDDKNISDETSEMPSDSIIPIFCERTTRSWESLQEEVDDEFGWRQDYIHQVGPVHHFNWLGQPMMQRSGTLPEESLAIMRVSPKVSKIDPDHQVQAILRNAFFFLDPVLLSLDEVDGSILELHGSALQHAAKGHVSKCYTGHGWWMMDDNEAMEEYELDVGDVGFYLEPSVVVGNGFAKASPLPTRDDYAGISDEMIAWAASEAEDLPKNRMLRKPSPLRQVTTIAPDATSLVKMPTLQLRAPTELGFPIDRQPAFMLGCDLSREPTPPPSSSPSTESGSLHDEPALILGYDRPREPTPPSSSPSSCESGSPSYDEPAFMLDRDRQREPTPPPSSISCESGSPSHDEPAFMLDRDRQREPTPPPSSVSCESDSPSHDVPVFKLACDHQRKPTPPSGLPQGCPTYHQPAFAHDCDHRPRNPAPSPQGPVRRKFVPPPQLRSPSGSSASTVKSTKKLQKRKRPTIAPTVSRVHNDEPSRDPEVYYSFPPSPSQDSKLKRFFRKAGQILVSGFKLPTQPLYSPGCFDVPMD